MLPSSVYATQTRNYFHLYLDKNYYFILVRFSEYISVGQEIYINFLLPSNIKQNSF